MDDISILIGGKAGFGIDKASLIIAKTMNRLGYRIYVYRDYPSLIRGGHTFSIIRASKEKVGSHKDGIDILLALNQDTADLHKNNISDKTIVIYDPESVKVGRGNGVAVSLSSIVKEGAAPEITRNTAIIGSLVKVLGIPWNILEEIIKESFPQESDINIKIARKGYDSAKEMLRLPAISQNPLPIFTGNETMSLGLVKAGLKAYISYPMTPTSPILHYLAARADEFALKVIHPESEIAVIMMACGFAYCGEKVAVGTSGGGFCLMTEGLSFSAMAELPVTVILGQRPGPSTGLPTYSAQTELGFALNAGQGEFTRFVAAPGDAEEAYYWPQVALSLSWKYRIPSLILTDKNLGEGTYDFDEASIKVVKKEAPAAFFPPIKDKSVKINSYEHDEFGISTEDPAVTNRMQQRRIQKEKDLAEELKSYECVKVGGNKNSSTAVLCWGSAKCVCVEAAASLGLKVIQVLTMSPFPVEQLTSATSEVKKLVCVEYNATGQLARLAGSNGFEVSDKILKYDGRPFSVDELEKRLKELLK